MLDAAESQMVAELCQHPGWGVVRRIVAERREKDMQRLARELYADGHTKQNVDYVRGLHQGAAWVLTQVENTFRSVSEERDK